MSDCCFTWLSAQSWQYRDRRKPEAGATTYSYFELLRGSFIVHSIIGSTVLSKPMDCLEHRICTTTMRNNIRPDRNSNLIPPGYKPQSIQMSHRGCTDFANCHPVSPELCITFIQRRCNVFDVAPTLYECYTNVLNLLVILKKIVMSFCVHWTTRY